MNKKSILLVAAFLAITIASFSQIEKKDILIGGTFGFNTGTPNGMTTTNNTNINPRIGYAIGNNSVLSARLGFGFGNSKTDGVSKTNNYSLSLGLSWRKYFPLNEKFGWYADLNGNYQLIEQKTKSLGVGSPNTIETYIRERSVYVNPGIYFMPVKGMIIGADVGGLGYSYSKTSYGVGSGTRNSGFSANFLNTFNFGIDFIINKKKK